MRLILFAAVCLTILGCGDEPQPTVTPTPTAVVVSVDMRHNRFAPARIVVRLGQTVRWTNRDAVAHTVASQDLRISSEAISARKTFEYRPHRAGQFRYFCTIHIGQTGVLIVSKRS